MLLAVFLFTLLAVAPDTGDVSAIVDGGTASKEGSVAGVDGGARPEPSPKPDAGVKIESSRPVPDRRFAAVKSPSAGPAESIGLPNSGCVKGAVELPPKSKDYVITRPERRRVYGHPALIGYVQSLAAAYTRAGLGRLHVGDLGQPIGGPTPSMHRSHQNGLDVDLWFAPVKDPKSEAPAFADLKRKTLLPAWNRKIVERVRLAAKAPEVARIFVHPAIKRALCKEAPGPWLHVIRPWFGHHDHLHVRLRCPAESPACDDGKPIPVGDGCDRSLDRWFEEPVPPPAPKKPASPPPAAPTMPQACLDLVQRTGP